ncbi:hypothetical protein C8Q70DRAFT_923777 [Cubamyces menziesii]|nr:hypothetical protein C8Q70DRAFT_923777 [Cubamyces menziesii]
MSTPWRGNRGRGRGGPSLNPMRGRGRGGAATSQPQPHRVYEPGKRHMELIASVSRSSGLEKDGDALRDLKVQEEYRAFIQTKATSVPSPGGQNSEAERHRKETEENLLILFRKLREGLMSTQRRDAFALEVYETSLHLSVLFNSPVQTTSTLSHLFPSFYTSYLQGSILSSTTSSLSNATTTPPRHTGSSHAAPQPHTHSLPPSARPSTVILLLHHLVSSYPSQLTFHTHLRQLHPALQGVLRARAPESADRDCARVSPAGLSSAHEWLTELARCLRRRNYARLDALSRHAVYASLSGSSQEAADRETPDLALEAIRALVHSLLDKARGTTWNIVRTAYREINLKAVPSGTTSEDTTAMWLARSLALDRPSEEAYKIVDAWLDERRVKGEARRKEGEGMVGRWILVKA